MPNPSVEDAKTADKETKTDMENVKADMEDFNADMEDVNANVEDVNANVEGVKADVEDVKADVEDVKADMEDDETDLEDVKADMEDVKAEVEEVKAEVEEVKAEVEEVKAEVEDVKAEVEDVKAEMEGVKEDMEGVKAVQKYSKACEEDSEACKEDAKAAEEEAEAAEADAALKDKAAYIKKIMVVGSPQCGKTNLIKAFIEITDSLESARTFQDIALTNFDVDNTNFGLLISEAPSEQNCKYERLEIYESADVVILCYGADSMHSLLCITSVWFRELPIVLVATKCDVNPRQVSYNNGTLTATNISAANFVECSANKKLGIMQVFKAAVRASLN